MNPDLNDSSAGLPLELLERIDDTCAEFEAQWKAGKSPRIEDYVDGYSDSEVPVLLKQLLKVEFEYRSQQDESWTPDNYRSRFPDYSSVLETVIAGMACDTNSVSPPLLKERIKRLGDYEIIEPIAQGGMGMVYKAWQPRLSRTVALKTILSTGDVSQEQLKRFRAEVESMARLDHPGIVPIHEVGEEDGLHFFTMAFVEGPSLSQKLQEGPLRPQDAATLVASAASIIQYAHEQGVVHRDLKPGNILLDKGGKPQITDFGLARRVDASQDLTATGQVLGTPAYMPPEQARGETQVGPAADVYALGAVLFATLTGRAPFQAATAIETLRQVVDDEPPALRTLNRRLSPDLETICQKCLEKKTGDRYPTAAELAADLRRWLHNKPIEARRSSVLERSLKWARRRPAMAALLVVSLLATAGAGGAIVAWHENENLTEALTDAARARALEEKARRAESIARDDAEKALEREKAARQEVESARERQRRSDYLRRIALARLEWQSGNTRRVDHLLKDCPREWRGWEWQFLKNLNHQELHQAVGEAPGLAFGPDGRTMYTGWSNAFSAEDALIAVRDLNTGEVLRHIGKRSNTQVRQILCSSDGSWLAVRSVTQYFDQETSSIRAQIRLERWNVQSAEVERVWIEYNSKLGSSLKATALSQDDRFLACCVSEVPNRRVIVWDVETHDQLLVLRHGQRDPLSVTFSPNGELIVAGFENGEAVVWRMKDGQRLATLAVSGERQAPVSDVKFDPSGEKLASLASNRLRIWETSDWTPVATYLSRTPHLMLSFDRTGKFLAVCGQRTTIDILDAQSGESVSELHGHKEVVPIVAYAPSGKLISKAHGGGHSLKFWNPDRSSGDAVTLPFSSPVRDLAFSPDGKSLAVGGGSKTGGDSFVSVVDLESREELMNGKRHRAAVTSVGFAPDGKTLISGSWDEHIGVWDIDSGKQIAFLYDKSVRRTDGIAVHPNGLWIATGDGAQVVVFDRDRSEVIATLSPEQQFLAEEVGFSPDGQWLVAVGDHSGAHVWSTANWEYCRNLAHGHGRTRYPGMAISPDSSRLVTTTNGGQAIVWDLASGRYLRALERHRRLVSDAAFDADGTRLATVSADGILKIWDVAAGDELLSLTGHVGYIYTVAFSPDGYLIATGGQDRTVRIYDATP